MISYEIAKRLKDAGFPQGVGDYVCKCGSKEIIVQDGLAYCDKKCGDLTYNPTLSELIEWCGEGFNNLGRYSVTKGWYCNMEEDEVGGSPATEGSTPEEAVAELGIALHTK